MSRVALGFAALLVMGCESFGDPIEAESLGSICGCVQGIDATPAQNTWVWGGHGAVTSTQTDASGSFCLHGLTPGIVRLNAAAGRLTDVRMVGVLSEQTTQLEACLVIAPAQCLVGHLGRNTFVAGAVNVTLAGSPLPGVEPPEAFVFGLPQGNPPVLSLLDEAGRTYEISMNGQGSAADGAPCRYSCDSSGCRSEQPGCVGGPSCGGVKGGRCWSGNWLCTLDAVSCERWMQLSQERANDRDEDCDTLVDEGIRTPIYRRHINVLPERDDDHCFSSSSTFEDGPCLHTPKASTVPFIRDTHDFDVYPLSIYARSDVRRTDWGAVLEGGTELAELWSCYDSDVTEHWYIRKEDRSPSETRDCAPVALVLRNGATYKGPADAIEMIWPYRRRDWTDLGYSAFNFNVWCGSGRPRPEPWAMWRLARNRPEPSPAAANPDAPAIRLVPPTPPPHSAQVRDLHPRCP